VHGDAIEAKDFVGWSEEPAGELKLAMEPHRLPLGFHPNFGTHELFPLLGFACRSIQDEQGQYTSYDADTQYMSAASALLTTHTLGDAAELRAARQRRTTRWSWRESMLGSWSRGTAHVGATGKPRGVS
jgi:hypothetical protein